MLEILISARLGNATCEAHPSLLSTINMPVIIYRTYEEEGTQGEDEPNI
jgi:hypothetical protein